MSKSRFPVLPRFASLRLFMRLFALSMPVLGLLVDYALIPVPGALQRTTRVASRAQPLRDAIFIRDSEIALQLLRDQWTVPELNVPDAMGHTLLHEAIARELPEVAEAIVARADFRGVNAKGFGGWTALHHAANLGYHRVCLAIISRADFKEFEARDILGARAIDLAQQRGHVDVVRLLRSA